MIAAQPDVETLKYILENMKEPGRLDGHPWTSRLFVTEALERDPCLRKESPGQQLISALGDLFLRIMPSTPPRRGKRLDTHWGAFGILAARYFAPLKFGTPVPNTLRDAWGRIDPAVLYCVYGRPMEALTEEEIKLYQVVGADLDYASASTISDWHKMGLQRFIAYITEREQFLFRTATPEPSPPTAQTGNATQRSRRKRWLWGIAAFLLVTVIALSALKVSAIYQRGVRVYQDVTALQQLLDSGIEIETVQASVPMLTQLRSDLSSFKEEAGPLLWLAPKLEWLPVYGNDLAAAPDLLELAEHLINTALHGSEAVQPVFNALHSSDRSLDPAGLTALLVQAQPALGDARAELDRALLVRKNIAVEQLSPRLRTVLVDRLDPMIGLADESVSLGLAVPGMLGAAESGPKTYLLLVQNEDELRPTGGFITSVGKLVIYKGQIISLEFEVVEEQDDWSQPYPTAPWQLQEYMNSPVLVLRDANWFADFPTSALWAEYLYAYTHSHSVDGVIAFDQHFLVMLLAVLGPLQLDGVEYPISDQNVIAYMRESKNPPTGEMIPANWTRKDFIRKLADAVREKLEGGDQDWPVIAQVLLQAMDQRHLLLQFDDPVISTLLAQRGWDNAIRPGGGDFLMVTDTNIGFNKTNAVVEIGLTYDVDLSDLDSPVGTLTLTHQNNADRNVPCIHWNTGEITGEKSYPIDRCYWSYVRVYKQAGVQLLDATPHRIPAEWMIGQASVPARVDVLDEEQIAGVQAFGTLLVVPGGQTLSTSFRFALPQTVLSPRPGTDELSLHLHLQKQPGTLDHALTIRVHLPKNALIKSIPPGASVQNNDLMLQTSLLTDVRLDVVFSIP